MGWGDEGQPIGRKNLEAIKLVPMLDFKVIARKVHFNKVLESCHSDLTSRPPPQKKQQKTGVKHKRACVRREVCIAARPVLGMGQNFQQPVV